MKKIVFAIALFSSFIFSSCEDSIKDLLNAEIKTSTVNKIPVSVIAGKIPLTQSVDVSLDNADTNKYLDKLKGVEIKKMTYKIINFTGDATGTVASSLEANGVKLHTVAKTIVKSEFDKGTIYEVTNAEELKKLGTSMFTNKKISLKLTGETDAKAAMSFDIQITLDLAVTANPL